MKIGTSFREGNEAVFEKSPYALTFPPTQPFLGIYPEGIQTIQKYICTRLFTAAFSVTTKYWQQPNGPV